jgi:phospholipid/cholesterol/gamma-HCH transport system substrate-binding protein
MRKGVLALIVIAVAICLWLSLRPPSQLNVRTYFHNAANLQRDTSVWVDGVEVGSVTSVAVRPELGERPVEVLMTIRTPYELRIPKGSIASLSTQGVLGPTVVDIDTRRASGPPIENGGMLDSLELANNQAARAIEVLGNALVDASKKLQEKEQSSSKPNHSDK